jgi:hypothetical protein
MLPEGHFARDAAQMIALDPQVQRHALDANADRPNGETVRILTSLLTGRCDRGRLRPVAWRGVLGAALTTRGGSGSPVAPWRYRRMPRRP